MTKSLILMLILGLFTTASSYCLDDLCPYKCCKDFYSCSTKADCSDNADESYSTGQLNSTCSADNDCFSNCCSKGYCSEISTCTSLGGKIAGAVLGSIAGVIGVIALIGFCLCCWPRRNKHSGYSDPNIQSNDQSNALNETAADGGKGERRPVFPEDETGMMPFKPIPGDEDYLFVPALPIFTNMPTTPSSFFKGYNPAMFDKPFSGNVCEMVKEQPQNGKISLDNTSQHIVLGSAEQREQEHLPAMLNPQQQGSHMMSIMNPNLYNAQPYQPQNNLTYPPQMGIMMNSQFYNAPQGGNPQMIQQPQGNMMAMMMNPQSFNPQGVNPSYGGFQGNAQGMNQQPNLNFGKGIY